MDKSKEINLKKDESAKSVEEVKPATVPSKKDQEMNQQNEKKQANATSDHPRMAELRAKVLDYAKENGKDFHPKDVELLATNNWWVNRFLIFCNQSFEKAYDHLIDTFKFRKESGIRSIDKALLPLECWMCSTAFIYLPDKQGCPTLYLRVKSHVKNTDEKLAELLKKFLLVLIDEIDALAGREHGYNLFLDLCGMGWSNLDLDMVHYMVTISRYRYPEGCKHCFVHGLPWFLNLIVKNIVAALPSDTSRKVKFVTGSAHSELPLDKVTSNFSKTVTDLNNNASESTEESEKNPAKPLPLEEFIARENLPSFLGGTATLNYRLAPRNAILFPKVCEVLFNYDKEKTEKILMPLKKVITDANTSYELFKKQKFEFEFDLENITTAYAQHLGL